MRLDTDGRGRRILFRAARAVPRVDFFNDFGIDEQADEGFDPVRAQREALALEHRHRALAVDDTFSIGRAPGRPFPRRSPS